MEASPFTVPATTPRAHVRLLAAASMVLALGFDPGVAGAKKQQTTCNGVPATIIANKNDVTIVGTPGPDVIVGNNKANIIHGGGGDDIICGGDGDDQLFGDEGNDQLFGGGGDDMLDGGADADRLFGEDGDDTLVGGLGDDVLNGGKGDDVVIGGQGADVALLGSGDDTFVWNPGDGSDVVEGQTGHDVLQFNGANVSETVDVSANGARLRVFRNVASITMDADGIEEVRFAGRGGADTVHVDDLGGTDVSRVSIDLAGVPGSGTGDGQVDHVIVEGTDAADQVQVIGEPGDVKVRKLSAEVEVTGAESTDELTVDGLGGEDVLDASRLAAGAIALTLNGGNDDDTLVGSQGDDLVNGGRGNDVALLGEGDDVFVWNPGHGSDVVEGQGGTDTLEFNGANVSEKIDLSANGERLRFSRDVASITMDTGGVEQVRFTALGGADTVVVDDLTGTGVSLVQIDLGAPAGSGLGDGQHDQVVVNATPGDDAVTVAGAPGDVTVTGLSTEVDIRAAESTDGLSINLLDGDDVMTASQLAAGALALTADGGAGDDILVGSAGDDVLHGGPDDDVLIGGPGFDVLDGAPGNDIIIQD
jgi:Ca2+-binding RTX toxin-like protein